MRYYLKDLAANSVSAAINHEWSLDLRPDEITEPEKQGRQSHVVFARDMVIKINYGNPMGRNFFRREPQILEALAGEDVGVSVPKVLHVGRNTDMFAMSRLENAPSDPADLRSDWAIAALAKFIVSFDRVMEARNIIPKVISELAWKPEKWLVIPKCPSFAEGLPELLKAARQEIFTVLSCPPHFGHFDLGPPNIFLKPKEKSVSIIDFGLAFYGDPHNRFGDTFMGSPNATPQDYIEPCIRLAQEVNRIGEPYGWDLKTKRILALGSVYLASMAEYMEETPAAREEHLPWFQRCLSQLQSVTLGRR